VLLFCLVIIALGSLAFQLGAGDSESYDPTMTISPATFFIFWEYAIVVTVGFSVAAAFLSVCRELHVKLLEHYIVAYHQRPGRLARRLQFVGMVRKNPFKAFVSGKLPGPKSGDQLHSEGMLEVLDVSRTSGFNFLLPRGKAAKAEGEEHLMDLLLEVRALLTACLLVPRCGWMRREALMEAHKLAAGRDTLTCDMCVHIPHDRTSVRLQPGARRRALDDGMRLNGSAHCGWTSTVGE